MAKKINKGNILSSLCKNPMISNERKVEEKIKDFPLPSEVSWRKEISMTNQPSYIFRHEELGDLGRFEVTPKNWTGS